jgi:hypothetical protein
VNWDTTEGRCQAEKEARFYMAIEKTSDVILGNGGIVEK